MSVETKPSQPTTQQPAPFDADRILDVLDARMDDFKYAMDGAQAEGRTDKSAEINWDRDGAISRTINRFGPEGRSTEEYVQYLRDMADQKQIRIASGALSEREARQQSEALKELLDTVRMIETDAANPEPGNKRLEGYRARQAKEMAEKTAAMNTADRVNSAAEADEIRAEFGLDTEKEKAELIDEVIKTCGANFFTAWPRSLAPEGSSGGFVEKPDARFLKPTSFNGVSPSMLFLTGAHNYFSNYPENKNKHIDQSMADKGITEVVYFAPVETDITEQRTTYTEERQGGVMGFGAKTVQVPKHESVVVGKQPTKLSEMVRDGGDENCVRLSYTISSRDQERRYDYQATDSRGGQTLNAEILLPERLAVKISEMVREDPSFMHDLIDQLAIRDMNIPEDVWRNGAGDANGYPLRPPYEKWRETDGGKSKMYIVEQAQIAEEMAQGTVDFNPNFVVEY